MSITSGFIKTKKYRTLSDLTHKLQSLWTAADTVEYTGGTLNGVNLSNTRPVSIISETAFNALTTSEKDNGFIYYVNPADDKTYIYTMGHTYGIGDPGVELTQEEYDALPSSKLTDGINYYITNSSSATEAHNVSYDNSTSGMLATNVQGAIDEVVEEANQIYEANGILGAKNLIPYPYRAERIDRNPVTYSGVVYTVSSDGTLTASGTASEGNANYYLTDWRDGNASLIKAGKYTLSGCPTGGNTTTYCLVLLCYQIGTTDGTEVDPAVHVFDEGNGATFTLTEDVWTRIYFRVANGTEAPSELIKPMLRFASDSDSTYQPYSETNYQLTHNKLSYRDNGILGAKNLIPYPYYNTQGTVNNGITYTLNAEGDIVANGTATAASSFYLAVRSGSTAIPLKAGIYILSGCPDGGASDTYSLHLNSYVAGTSTAHTGIYNIGGDTEGVFTKDVVCGIYIDIREGVTVDNLTFKPMLRLATDTDDTWQPYAMTNKELTDVLSDIPNRTVYYGTCTEQAANQTKAVVVDSSQGFTLEAGIVLFVRFDANNTYSATADAPVKLNVNSTGAKNVYYGATNTPTGTNTTAFGRENYVIQYCYDGTDWVWGGSSTDNNTTYSNMSATELNTGTATTARTISAKVLTNWNTAAHTTYSNTTSGLSATNVQDAIDGFAPKVLGSVTADGFKDHETLLNELHALVSAQITADNFRHLTLFSNSANGSIAVYQPAAFTIDGALTFMTGFTTDTYVAQRSVSLKASGSLYTQVNTYNNGTLFANQSTNVPASGNVYKIVLN